MTPLQEQKIETVWAYIATRLYALNEKYLGVVTLSLYDPATSQIPYHVVIKWERECAVWNRRFWRIRAAIMGEKRRPMKTPNVKTTALSGLARFIYSAEARMMMAARMDEGY